ncbi:actin bundling protein [Pelomyxa schiedti]|nr:actin bundling protein [Pelomyxa schiedti]
MATKGMKKEEKWQIIQEKAFTGWMAQTLAKRQMTVTDLRTDLEDGILLINFFELLAGSKMKERYDSSPKTRIQKVTNCHLALRFLERETGINMAQSRYAAEDFVDAHKDLRNVLGLLWTLYRRFRMNVIVESTTRTGSGKAGPEEMLLEWVKSQTASYSGVTITNYRTSFSNGLAFAALCHLYDPEILGHSWEEILAMDPRAVLEFVMTHAERKMGISRLLDVDEILEGTVDDRALALYTSLFHSAITNKKQMADIATKLDEVTERGALEKKSREELVKMNYDLTANLAQANIQIEEEKKRWDATHEELVALREQFLAQQRLIEEKDREIALLRQNLTNVETERNTLLAKTLLLEERNNQLAEQIEATQVLCDAEQTKNKKLAAELKSVKEELTAALNKVASLTEAVQAKEGGEKVLTEQLAVEEKKTRSLVEKKALLEEHLQEVETEVEALKSNLKKETSQKEKTENQLNEHKEQFRVNTRGLAVLRRNLDQHLDDLHRWQKYLDGSSTEIDVVNEAAGALAEKISSLPFIEQLNVLSERLEEENVEMTNVLQEKLAHTAATKGGKAKASAKAAASTTASTETSSSSSGGSKSATATEGGDDVSDKSEKRPHSKSESGRHHKNRSGSSGGH